MQCWAPPPRLLTQSVCIFLDICIANKIPGDVMLLLFRGPDFENSCTVLPFTFLSVNMYVCIKIYHLNFYTYGSMTNTVVKPSILPIATSL
jgi:hypothetical protein